MTFPTETIQVE